MKELWVIEKRGTFMAVRFVASLHERLRAGTARKLTDHECFVYHRIRKTGESRYWYDDPRSNQEALLVFPGQWVLVGGEGEARVVSDLRDYQEVP